MLAIKIIMNQVRRNVKRNNSKYDDALIYIDVPQCISARVYVCVLQYVCLYLRVTVNYGRVDVFIFSHCPSPTPSYPRTCFYCYTHHVVVFLSIYLSLALAFAHSHSLSFVYELTFDSLLCASCCCFGFGCCYFLYVRVPFVSYQEHLSLNLLH